MLGYSSWRSDKDRVTRNYTYERWAWEADQAEKKAQAEKVKNPTPKPVRRSCATCSSRSIEELNMLCACQMTQQLSDLLEVDTH